MGPAVPLSGPSASAAWACPGPTTQPAATTTASIASIHRALDLGVNLIDTADVYGPFTNEELVGRALAGRRDQAVLATKVGLVVEDGRARMRRNGRPEHVRAAIDASLRRLSTDHVDLYQLHRVDPDVPLEETWGAMAELVEAGKAARSACPRSTSTSSSAPHAIHPVASVQSELSLWTRDALAEVLPWCAAHGAAFLPFSPLGRGFLTGALAPQTSSRAGDFRGSNPRFRRGDGRQPALVDASSASPPGWTPRRRRSRWRGCWRRASTSCRSRARSAAPAGGERGGGARCAERRGPRGARRAAGARRRPVLATMIRRPSAVAVIATMAAFVVAGCSGSSGSGAASPTPTVSGTASPSTTPTPAASPSVVRGARPDLHVSGAVVTGLAVPWGVAFVAGGERPRRRARLGAHPPSSPQGRHAGARHRPRRPSRG